MYEETIKRWEKDRVRIEKKISKTQKGMTDRKANKLSSVKSGNYKDRLRNELKEINRVIKDLRLKKAIYDQQNK